ncbi:hypothetical protein J2S11_001663 [Bacillus horti]|uniref:Uncharacterized protein n=1 Tax=Caldalkalibacillus horti TaxID=77523 RepID=A0ABT9VXQ9_9BACI|nr:hypothetical protein [Bacillus horti]
MLSQNNGLKDDWKRLVTNCERKYSGFSTNFNAGIEEGEWNRYELLFDFNYLRQ